MPIALRTRLQALRLTATVLALLLGALLWTGCTGLFFHPEREWLRTPADLGLDYEELRLESADGVALSAWYLPASQQPARATILFLHGNAENMSTHVRAVDWLPERGFNVLLLDYRGYGASEGEPSVKGALTDIDAAMRYLLARDDIDSDRLIVLGQSLGGALALHYVAHSAHREHIRAVVADSAFSGYRQIAREKLQSSWLTWLFAWPLSTTVTKHYKPLAAAPKLHPIPVLFIHAWHDEVIPAHHSEDLYAAAREPKELWITDARQHIRSLSRVDVRTRLVAWLEAQLPGAMATSPSE